MYITEKTSRNPWKNSAKILHNKLGLGLKKCRNMSRSEEKPNDYQIESKSTTKWQCPNDNGYWLKAIEGTIS